MKKVKTQNYFVTDAYTTCAKDIICTKSDSLITEIKNSDITIECKKPTHFPPHIHEAIEIVYITKGALELGVDRNCITWKRAILQLYFRI